MTIPDGFTDLAPGKIAAVTTYLEMRRAPDRAPSELSSGFQFRSVMNPDPSWYRELFRTVGEAWLWYSRLQLDDEQLTAILQDPRVDVFALEHGGRDQGLLELDRRQSPEIELAYLGLAPGLIGQGLGRFLMDRALQIAWSHHPSRVILHTCNLDHPRALAFYEKAGFVPYKRAIEVANDPRLTGALPRTAAPQIPLID
jgi:GNAT superfamily N-acetyltransferase